MFFDKLMVSFVLLLVIARIIKNGIFFDYIFPYSSFFAYFLISKDTFGIRHSNSYWNLVPSSSEPYSYCDFFILLEVFAFASRDSGSTCGGKILPCLGMPEFSKFNKKNLSYDFSFDLREASP